MKMVGRPPRAATFPEPVKPDSGKPIIIINIDVDAY